MAQPRFFLSPDEVNAFKADQWEHTQLTQLADTWEQQALSRIGVWATPVESAVQTLTQAGQPTRSPAVSAEPSQPSGPSVAPQGFNPDLLDLSKPPPIAPDVPLPSPSTSPRAPSPSRPAAAQPSGGLVDYARQAAQRAGIDPDLFVRQINQESGFDPTAGSPKGALGIAQIVPKWHPGVDPTDPVASLDYAANLMASHLKTYGGDIRKALVAYNGGQGAVNAMNAGTPYSESSTYLDKILGGGGGTPSTQDPNKVTAFQTGNWEAIARSQLGDPYVWGSQGGRQDMSDNPSGFDCSGFVSWVYNKGLGLNLPAFTGSIQQVTQSIRPDEARPGDLVMLMNSSDPTKQHVGIYIGNGQMINSTGGGVQIGAVWDGMEYRRDPRVQPGQGVDLLSSAVDTAMQRPATDQEQARGEEVRQALAPARDETVSNPFGEAFRQVSDVVGGALSATGAKVQSPDTGNPVPDALGTGASAVGTGLHTVLSPVSGASEFFPTGGPLAGPLVGGLRTGAGYEQMGREGAAEAERQLRDLTRRQDAGEPGLDAEIDHWAAVYDQATHRGGGDQAVFEAAQRNPDISTLEGLGGIAQGVAAAPLAAEGMPLAAKAAAAVIDPQTGLPSMAGRAFEAAGPVLRTRQAAMADPEFASGGLGKLIPRAPETAPPAVTTPALGRMVGTAAEQAAVGAPDEGRAANLLLEKFPEEVRPHLQDVAERFGQFAGQRRGVITDDQAEANAAEIALGTTAEKWIKTPAGKAFNQEQAIALGNTLTQVGKEYDDLLATTRTARSGGSITPEMEAQLADKTLELAALAGVRSGAAAEAGRALRSFRQALGGGAYADRNKAIDAAFKAIGTDKERFAQWVEEFSQLDDPVSKYKMLQGLQEPSWWDRISLLRYASMLSSTTTHMVNAFGNVINVGLDVALKPASVGIDVARAGTTGGERTRYMGELAPQVRGLLDGAVAGFFDGIQTLKTGINPRDLGKFEDIRPGFQSGNKVVDAVVEMPLRLLGFSDNVFRGAAFGANARAAAARKGIQEGLSGQALRERIVDIMQNLPAHPDIAQQADKAAAAAVLQESNRFASAVTSIGRGTGAQNTAARIVREIIVPFAKTPANIFRQGAEMTPYGLLKVRDLSKAGDVGGATDAAARVAFGSALMVGVGALAANGAVTGGYPADPKDRDTLPPGWQPWSVRLPNGEGGHTYVSFSQLGPIAIPMAIGAIAGNTLREGLVTDPGTVAGSLGRFMVDQTFLQGISALADAFKDPKRYGENFTEQMATSFVPYAALSREVTRILGQADRDPKGAIQAIQALVPGVAENVPRRQDALGRDIRSTQTGIGAAVSPARYSSTKAEPVLSAFRGAGIGIPDAPKEIRIASQVTGSTSPPIKLTEQEQNDYQRLFGEQLQKRLLPMVTDAGWDRRPIDGRKALLEAQMKAARAYAESQVYGKMAPEDRQKRMQEGRTSQKAKPLPTP